jgi:hypothetical protein
MHAAMWQARRHSAGTQATGTQAGSWQLGALSAGRQLQDNNQRAETMGYFDLTDNKKRGQIYHTKGKYPDNKKIIISGQGLVLDRSRTFCW